MRGEGARVWVFPDGYLPRVGPDGEYVGHDCICVVNTGNEDALALLDLYFEDREPVLGIEVRVPARRSLHLRMDRPEALGGYELPREVPYSARLRSSAPVVAQYSRLDVTQPNATLMTSLGYSATPAGKEG